MRSPEPFFAMMAIGSAGSGMEGEGKRGRLGDGENQQRGLRGRRGLGKRDEGDKEISSPRVSPTGWSN